MIGGYFRSVACKKSPKPSLSTKKKNGFNIRRMSLLRSQWMRLSHCGHCWPFSSARYFMLRTKLKGPAVKSIFEISNPVVSASTFKVIGE